MGRSSDIVGGSSYPNNSYRLGIPAPTAAPTVAVVAETSFDGVITFANGSAVVTVTSYTSGSAAAHGAVVGEYVTLAGFSTTQGVEADNINGTFQVKTVPSVSTLTLELSAAATGAGDTASVSNGVKVGGKADAKLDYETSYVYTFVSAYGEEGPPSPASTVITTDDNQSVAISGLETSAGSSAGRTNTNLTKKRLYRSNTGSNTTLFQFVAELNLSTATYTDTSTNSELAEVIPATYWIGPPNEDTATYPDGAMKGLCAMPGGMFAGFVGKRICFSEPYMPHAWPAGYRITIEEEIIGIAVGQGGLLVGTKGTPYVVVGNDPQSMQALRLETGQQCLSKLSMVDMGAFVFYAGPDGLIGVQGSSVIVLTEAIVTPEQWQADYYPSTIKGFLWEGKYVGFYSTGSGFGGFIFDPRESNDGATFYELDVSALVRGGFTDPDDNQLYTIVANKIEKFQGGSTDQTYNWKSKEFVTPKPTSMGFIKVDAEAFPVTLKVYADGTLYYTGTIALSGTQHSVSGSYVNAAGGSVSISSTDIPEPVLRLPARLGSTFSVEVESAKTVNEVCIGESIEELRAI